MVGAVLLANGKSTVHFSCMSNQDRSFSPLKPSMVRLAHNTPPYWASLQADIEAHLKQAIPMKEPLVVFEPMHHLVFAAPTTTVPALCLAACELVGGQRHQAMDAASALLLLHAAIYTHEHLPLTDRPKPKPKPMVPHTYSPNIELLTADGIVPFAFELLARSDDPDEGRSGRILRVIAEMAHAVGSEGVIDAQYRKILSTQSDGEESCHVEGIKDVAEKNEGALYACGAACGAVLGGGSEEEIDRLRKYGFYVGMIQTMLQNGLREDKRVQETRNLALNQLHFFTQTDLHAISTFINV